MFIKKNISPELFKEAADALLSPLVILSSLRNEENNIINFIYEYVNKEAENANQISAENIIGKKLLDIFPGHIENGIFEIMKDVVLTGNDWRGELKYTGAGGGKEWDNYLKMSVRKFADGIVATWYDITELKNQNSLLDTILEVIPVGVWVADKNGNIIRGNKAGQMIWGGVEYTPLEELHKYKGWWYDSGEPLTSEDWAISRTLKKGNPSLDEVIKIECFDGTKKIISNSAVPLVINNEIAGVVAVNFDITGLKEIEKKLKDSLGEKEILLKEIHHRVKNNLQIISSLLNIQRGHIEGEKVNDIFINTQNRIRSMALVHEQLYAKGVSEILLNTYLQDLMIQLISSYSSRKLKIDYSINGDDVTVSISNAVNVGLIMNELFINSIKHAFVGRESGSIDVKLKINNNFIDISVADNGRGLPDSFHSNENESLGMLLIDSFSSQLGGKYEFKSENGTQFHLYFKNHN